MDKELSAGRARVDTPATVTLAADRAHLVEELEGVKRQLAERSRELERSEGRFFDVIDRNADAIVVVDRRGTVRFANSMAARLFGVGPQDLVESEFGFPLVEGETTELDLVCNGKSCVAEMRVVESEWEGQVAYIASLRDVTDRKRAEESARRLQDAHAAQAVAEGVASRFRVLAESSAVLSESLDYGATLAAIARVCATHIADWALVFGVDEGGMLRCLEAAHRDGSTGRVGCEGHERPHDAAGSVARPAPTPCPELVMAMLRSRTPVLANDAEGIALESMLAEGPLLDMVRGWGLSAYMVVSMVARDRAIGAIVLGASDPLHRFSEQDLLLAQELGFRAAIAADNALLYGQTQEANQAKSHYLAVISHDLRTPLTAIIGYADLLDLGIPERLPEKCHATLQRMRTAARHVRYLIDELLAFARLDVSREELRLREIDARDIAAEVAAVMEPLALERRLHLRISLPEAPVPLRTDPDKLRQVLLNLVGNAVKYTPQGGGEVRLTVTDEQPGPVVLRVEDTGVGIAAEHLEQIFEPFWQVERSERPSGAAGAGSAGTGLGLSVVRRLVQLLGGDISVDSVMGRGSTFEVTLPREG